MAAIYDDCPEEVLASGPIFLNTGKTLLGRKTWALRKLVFTGMFLINYDKTGDMMGKWNVLGCEVKSLTVEEVGSADAQYAFAVFNKKQTYVFCAVSETDRQAWTKLIADQIVHRKDILYRYLMLQERILAVSLVMRKSQSLMSKLRLITSSPAPQLLIMTDASRLLLIDTKSEELIDQMVWDPVCPPNATIISNYVLKLQLEKKVFLVNFHVDEESETDRQSKSRETMTALFEDDEVLHKPTNAAEWRDVVLNLPSAKPTSARLSGKLDSVLEDVLSHEFW